MREGISGIQALKSIMRSAFYINEKMYCQTAYPSEFLHSVKEKKRKEISSPVLFAFSSRIRMIRRCRPPFVSFRCKRPLPRPTKLPRPVVDNAPFVLPINIRCNACSQYIYQGTHLFVRKREVLDERYLDFECCLICLKCTNCSAEIRIKSDPENRDYIVESGATKKRQVAVSKKRKREAEEGGDELKSLENTTLGSKIEIAALDEMKSMEL
nr:coiled-coil domain-containing protein 94 homolog isoform X2 [Quercus suber]